VALILATARSLIVAPLARGGSVLHVARLPLAPGSHSSSPPLARSSLPRSLAVARCSMSLGCPSLQGRTHPRHRSLAQGHLTSMLCVLPPFSVRSTAPSAAPTAPSASA